MKTVLVNSKISLIFFLFSISVIGQEIDYTKTQVTFLYHFTRYVSWPNQGDSKFIIAVLSNSENFNTIEAMMKSKNKSNIEIVKYSPDVKCQILFISADKSSKIEKTLSEVGGKNILIVTEKSGMIQKGSCINLVLQDNRLKLEISKTNISNNELKVSNELLKLASVIN